MEGLNLRTVKRSKRLPKPTDYHLATDSNRSPGETCLCFTKSCQAITRLSDNSNCWISSSPSAVAILSSEVTVPGGTRTFADPAVARTILIFSASPFWFTYLDRAPGQGHVARHFIAIASADSSKRRQQSASSIHNAQSSCA